MWQSFSVLVIIGLLTQNAFSLQVDKGKVTLEKLEDYELCQKHDYSGDWCDEALKNWVKQKPEDAFKAGKLTRKAMNAWGAVPFFATAFMQKNGDCKDSDVQLAVIDGLKLPISSKPEIVESSRKIAFDICFKELKAALLNETSPGSIFFENTCTLLSEKGELQGVKLKKCKSSRQGN